MAPTGVSSILFKSLLVGFSMFFNPLTERNGFFFRAMYFKDCHRKKDFVKTYKKYAFFDEWCFISKNCLHSQHLKMPLTLKKKKT